MTYKLIELDLEDIDSQHKKLIDCMNKLHSTMQAGSDKPTIEDSVLQLRYYSMTHLSYEEQGMRVMGFPELKDHAQSHKYFIEKLDEIETKLGSGSSQATAELIVFLRDWLLNHIGKEDLRYARFVLGAHKN